MGNITCQEYRTELDEDGINQLFGTLNNDNDVFGVYYYFKGLFHVDKCYVEFVHLLLRVGGGTMLYFSQE
jgi:hypothetical protein